MKNLKHETIIAEYEAIIEKTIESLFVIEQHTKNKIENLKICQLRLAIVSSTLSDLQKWIADQVTKIKEFDENN